MVKQKVGAASALSGEEQPAGGAGARDEAPAEGDGRVAEAQEVIIYDKLRHRDRWGSHRAVLLSVHA